MNMRRVRFVGAATLVCALGAVGTVVQADSLPGLTSSVSADFNGDGKMDTAVALAKAVRKADNDNVMCAIEFRLAGAAPKSVTYGPVMANPGLDDSCELALRAGDFNGDKTYDVVAAGRSLNSGAGAKAFVVSANGRVATTDGGQLTLGEDDHHFMDLNGDGKADTLWVAQPGSEISYSYAIGTGANNLPVKPAGYVCGMPSVVDLDKSNPAKDLVAQVDMANFSCYEKGEGGLWVQRNGSTKRERLVPVPAGYSYSGAPTFTDLNADGHLDLTLTWVNRDDKTVTKQYFNDGRGNLAERVAAAGPLIARNDRVVMKRNTFEKGDINVLGNDVIPPGENVTVKLTKAPRIGKAVALPNGRIRYDRTGKGMVRDLFEYSVTDSRGRVSKAVVLVEVRR